MKHWCVVVTQYGGPEVLRVVEADRPEPKPGELRVRVLAAGVSLPDVMMREGIHPETPRLPFTPGWDLVGVLDSGRVVAALPIQGAWAEFVCLPERELVPVPPGLDPAEAVSLVLNYVTAYQMLHRFAKVRPGQRVLVHGGAGGVGTALLQLGRVAELELYATCSARSARDVSALGATPLDYGAQDFVREIRRLTGDGVDAVFDPLAGRHLWLSRRALAPGGTVVGYGVTTSLRGQGLNADRPGRRQRFRGMGGFACSIAASFLLPGRRRVLPYSIQWLKRLWPEAFRQDLGTLFELLREKKIQPLVARRFPLAGARQAQELLERGGVTGKVVLVA
jgi:NADPH:quinone reductase-like Zn-dependent oxidoreductase